MTKQTMSLMNYNNRHVHSSKHIEKQHLMKKSLFASKNDEVIPNIQFYFEHHV